MRMHIELRKVKIYPRLSEETLAFNADVYIDGKKRGTAENTGKGGCTSIWPRDLEDQLVAYAKTLPQRVADNVTNKDGTPFTYDVTCDHLIDDLVADYETQESLRRKLAKFYVFVQNGKLLQLPRKGVDHGDPEKVREYLKEKYGNTVLNFLPMDEALRIWRAS